MSIPSNLIPTTILQLPEDPSPSDTGWLMYVNNGNTYKVQANAILNIAGVPATRQINAGNGLTGGGTLAANVTLAVANGGIGATQLDTTGVTAATYGDSGNYPIFSVDANGRITSATTAALPSVSGFVPTSRQVIAGTGLSGGGTLTGDVTLDASLSNIDPLAGGTQTAGVSNSISREDHVHPAVNLTDTTQTAGVLSPTRGGTGTALTAPAAGGIAYSDGANILISSSGTLGAPLLSGGTGAPYFGSAVLGTVTSVSVVSANGFAGTVANATTTPAITLNTTVNGVLKGNGTALSAAVSGVDYAPATSGVALLYGNGSGGFNNASIGTGLSFSTGTLTNTAPDQVVALTGSGSVSITGTYPSFTITSPYPSAGIPNSTGSAWGTSYSTTGSGTVVALQTNPTVYNPNIDVIDFDTSYATTLTAGQMGWDGNNTLGIGMIGGNVIQHIGEDQFFYCKATSAINKGQVVMFTGAVGASGVPTGAPATGISNGTYIMGIAAEAIALNGFGLVQCFGTLRNVNTSGFVDGDILWYDPAVTGGLTKTQPTAPNIKAQMAAVINGGSVGGGTILIRINPGSVLGGTDSNVQINSPVNNSLLQYSSSLGYWRDVSILPSGAVVGTTDTQTLTNKRIDPRVLASTANSATPTLNTDNYDTMVITGQSVAITSFTTNLTGTPVNGQKLWISITGTTAIALTWGASFESSTVTLPTTTVSTNRLDVGFVWNVATSKWRCVGAA